MAYFNNQQYEKAREAFIAAGRDERSVAYADQWITYMDSELARQKSLQDDDVAMQEEKAALQAELIQEEAVQDEEVEVPGEAQDQG
jgi:GTPase Era involved in 16S rRNA processing